MLAFAASSGTAFVLEYFDTSLRTPGEVQDFLGLPVLASLPYESRAPANGRAGAAENGSATAERPSSPI